MMSFYAQPGWTSGVFDGVTYRYLSIKPAADKPVLLLLHGFPTGPITYHRLIPLLTAQGYGIILPETPGYGESDKPADLEAYARKKLSDQIVAILDKESVQKVVVFGHDFGAPLAYRFVKFHPDRSIALVLASVAYSPPVPRVFDWEAVTKVISPIVGYDNFGYWGFFVRHPEAAQIIEEHLNTFVSVLLAPAEHWKTHFTPTGVLEETLVNETSHPLAPWASEEFKKEITEYIRKSGVSGMLNWFKAAASDVNIDDEKDLDPRLTLPYLFLAAERDATAPAVLASQQGKLCDDLTVKSFKAGHWILEEEADAVAKGVLDWFKEKGI